MSIFKRWPEGLILLGIALATAVLVGCSALQEITPASQAALERQGEAVVDYQNAALEEAEAGNTVNSVIMSVASVISMLVGTSALSRRRRSSPANDIARAEAVERGNKLRVAGLGTPPA